MSRRDPFWAARLLAGRAVNRKRVQWGADRYRGTGFQAASSKPAPGYWIFSYLLRGMTIDRPGVGGRHHRRPGWPRPLYPAVICPTPWVQGSQFTSMAFTGPLERAGIPISIDYRGRRAHRLYAAVWR